IPIRRRCCRNRCLAAKEISLTWSPKNTTRNLILTLGFREFAPGGGMPLRASMTKEIARRALLVAALAALAFQTAAGQSNESKAGAGTKPMAAGAASAAPVSNASDVTKTLKTAAEAIGLARWSGVGG